MGTNYYLKLDGNDKCEHCGRSDSGETFHIGKSSAGWCFSLHVIPERGINDLCDWLPLFDKGQIEDEYGTQISIAEMIDKISNRSWSGNKEHDPSFYSLNQAQPGPNGLLRHQISWHCVKHGEGTWDCVVGEFF